MMMKRLIILLFILIGGTALSFAYDGCHQHLSPDEFRTKQKAFISEKAELTDKEAEKFFPIYFELQDKKKELSDKAWKLMRKSKDEKLTDAQYEEILLKVYDLRIKSDELEKNYYARFKKVLSPKKIYYVQRAEMRFHREILKGVQQRRANAPQRKSDAPQRGKK